MKNLLGQKDDVLIKLRGTPNDDGMVVFSLDEAEIKPKRMRHAQMLA